MEFFFPGRRSYAQAHQGVMALYTCLDSKAYRKGGDKSFIVDFFLQRMIPVDSNISLLESSLLLGLLRVHSCLCACRRTRLNHG